MRYYPSGVGMTFDIPLVDEDGSVTTAVSIQYRVLDANGAELVNWTSLTGYTGDSEAQVTVSSFVNTTSASRDVRVIELRCTPAIGGSIFTVEHYYGLESGSGALTRYENTAVTAAQAEMIADELGLEVWEGATKHKKVNALLESYRRLKDLSFEIRKEGYCKSFKLRDLTSVEIAGLDSAFLGALQYAQLVEAETVMSYDPEEEKRRSYLLMDTIGESKQMYRTVKPMELSVSSGARKYLSAYLKAPSLTIGRA